MRIFAPLVFTLADDLAVRRILSLCHCMRCHRTSITVRERERPVAGLQCEPPELSSLKERPEAMLANMLALKERHEGSMRFVPAIIPNRVVQAFQLEHVACRVAIARRARLAEADA